MKSMLKSLALVAGAFVVLAGNLHAQSVAFIGTGSSAIFLEMGQAAAAPAVGGCVWTSAKGSGTPTTAVSIVDTRIGSTSDNGYTGTVENGAAWVAWTPGTGGTCAAPASDSKIYADVNLDSVIGDRCFLASPKCTFVLPTATIGQADGNQLSPVTGTITALPSAIQSALNGQPVTAALTDIRPEDAKFASIRMFTSCGTQIGTSQYYGLGFQGSNAGNGTGSLAGTTVAESTASGGLGSGTFHVLDFNLTGTDPISGNTLPTSYTVSTVGAQPIVVFVNPANINGFGNIAVNNLDDTTLAGYFDGTLGRTADAIPAYSNPGAGTSSIVTANAAVVAHVFVREPLSGTYNTFEFNTANTVRNQSSQDVGLASVNANTAGANVPFFNCTSVGGAVSSNPLTDSESRGSATSTRQRAIGTGDEVKAVINQSDAIGYAFWSAANFASATSSNAKYLTIDGIDPLQQNWTSGLVPTSTNGLLGNVTMSHVKDGTYPIWSLVRVVSSSPTPAGVTTLVNGAQNFISQTQPDFVPVSSLAVRRSHFAPPTVSFPSSGTNQPSNGDTSNCSTTEAGGDVGGAPVSIQADYDFCKDSGVSTVGLTGVRD